MPVALSRDAGSAAPSARRDPTGLRIDVHHARRHDHIAATGTAAVALELARRYGCRVVGVDQSAEMLAAGRARVRAAGLNDRIELGEARAEALPHEDETFAGLTFAGLLRYVDDPGATLRELARLRCLR